MQVKLNNFDYTNWINGEIDDYYFEAMHHNHNLEYAIDGGRVSELAITKEDEWIADYNQGWELAPKTAHEEEIVCTLVNYLENMPTRYDYYNEVNL